VIFGASDIQVPEESILTILVNEVLNPFFVFETLCIVLWLVDEAYWFAFAILAYNVI
jgi:cation-transporting ATPase 13A3/4/5